MLMRVQIYCRPTYEFVEVRLMDRNQRPMSLRNCMTRLLITTVYIVLVTLISCMIPFFGEPAASTPRPTTSYLTRCFLHLSLNRCGLAALWRLWR